MGSKDAALFKSLIYKSEELLKIIQASTLLGGIGGTVLGLLLLLITCLVARPGCVRLSMIGMGWNAGVKYWTFV